ncbi:diacylglycerol kinase family protein [Finegoldia magna]|uniref:diacylglycerol/lipid kinase family protein n=1 Tax=Finegoldia magna TaxID=1260 RepID=UPI00076427C8|nr:diacylglycerol kinase family protein [Finegoldia magna]KXA07820.1 lipid kinase, YegS/Rv2252/BmrU family [Finegoldia magna]MDU1213318.1 diacylglycerol kinase family lipid kinase [Finegoldia magna]
MKKIKIISNPSSGSQAHSRDLTKLINYLIEDNFVVQLFKTKKKNDAYNEAFNTSSDEWDLIVISGGDGTVNEVVNGICDSESDIPITIYSTGTVNDFATYLDLPSTPYKLYRMIKTGKIIKSDVGKISNEDSHRFFINVFAVGNIASVSYVTDKAQKAIFGRLAYIVEGLKELPNTLNQPMELKIKTKDDYLEVKSPIMIISNSNTVGGFENICPQARIDDKKLDVLIIKHSRLKEVAQIMIDAFSSKHIYSEDVLYFQTDTLTIESSQTVPGDVDGEYGGNLPVKVEINNKPINILVRSD